MELKRVEIVGFKSFPERITVEFDKGITAIVGPNGSGKSNIADAVKWVLGEQSAKSLRGSKMEDVIFAGTERRRPVGFAEVTLVLNNDDKKMPVDYKEVQIRRRLFRSGESEYAINGGKCRLKDIQEMIMDTGIGKDGYSMIGQGQIDRLLSSKPQERRMIFEEAAGITKYKTRKEEAEKKLQEQSSQLVRVGDILTELNGREEPLREQSVKAKEYLALKDELKIYEVSAFLGEYDSLKASFDKASRLLEENAQEIEAAKNANDQARQESAAFQESLQEERNLLSQLEEDLTNTKLELEKLEGDKRVLLGKQEHEEETQKTLSLRLEEVKNKIKDRLETLDKENEKIRSLEKETEEKQTEVDEAKARVTKAIEDQQNLEEILRNKQKELLETRNQILDLTMDLERSQMAYEQNQLLQEDFQSEKERLEKSLEELTAVLKEKQENEAAREIELEKIQVEVRTLTEKNQGIQSEITELRKQQEAFLLQMKDLMRRRDWLRSMQTEYEGYSQPVKAVMKQSNRYGSRIRGTLSDVLRIPEQYVTAMEMVLGQAVQNIVVEDTETAKELVEMLRKDNIGRATFLPIDSVIGRSHSSKDDQIRRMEGVLGFADELVDADPIYQKIVQRQLGNVVVTKTFENARSVSRIHGNAVRVVTLEGDIFNIGGSITGGSVNKKGTGLLSRKKEIDEVAKSLQSLRSQADDLQKTLSAKNDERFQTESDLRARTQEEGKAKERFSSAASEKKQAAYEEERVRTELDSLIEQEKNRVSNHNEEEVALNIKRSLLEDEQKKVSEGESVLADLQVKIKEAAIHAQKEREAEGKKQISLASLKQEKTFMEQSIQWEEKEIDALNEEADGILQEQTAFQETNLLSKKELEEIDAKIKEKASLIETKSAAIEEKEASVKERDEMRESSIKKVEDTLKHHVQLEKEKIRLENQAEKAKNDLNDLTERMWNDYEMTIGTAKDLSSTGFADDEKMREAAALSKTKRHQNIVRLKNAIRDLGPVNVHAIEEYQSLTERIAFLTKQQEDILESTDNLTKIIERMTKRMEKQFEEGFRQIQASFDKVFKQMFGGGQAILKLSEGNEALEAGIEINVQPPGKKLQSMMLLSGGERALTAIALLFAIQELNPAPFCILDEIEAALDDANVDRFAHFLQDMCKEIQFIVITHRKGTMAAAHTLYGVTMEEKGVSKCVSVQFDRE